MGRGDIMGEIVVPVAYRGLVSISGWQTRGWSLLLFLSFRRRPESRGAVGSCFFSFHSPGGRPGADTFLC